MKRILYIIIFLSVGIKVNQLYAQTASSIGSTAIEVSVGQLGNATATIPIFCPPGRKGIQPQITLAYNSMSKDGIAGRGFSIAGVSMITRGGKNFHLDGQQRGLKLDAEDNFYLDGQRLIRVGGSPEGTAGCIYRTESDLFARITFEGNRFTVETKDGGRLFYGHGGASQLFVNGGNNLEIHSYALYRSYDIDGNYIEYNYETNGGQMNIKDILYTGFDCTLLNTRTCSLLPASGTQNKISFTYSNTQNANRVWIDGKSMVTNRKLDKIEVIQGAIRLRLYDLQYSLNNGIEYLTQVKETNLVEESYDPIKFIWENNQPNQLTKATFNSYPSQEAKTMTILNGDFDGNGKSDLFVVERGWLEPESGKCLASHQDYFIVSANGLNNGIGGPVINSGKILNWAHNNGAAIQNICKILVGDLDQDGLDDLLFQTIDFYNMPHSKMNLHIGYHAMLARIENNKLVFHVRTDFFAPFEHYNIGQSNPRYDDLHITPYLTDCDGDGLPDLMTSYKQSYKNPSGTHDHFELISLMVTYGKNRQSIQTINIPYAGNGTAQMSQEIIGDFNGNGKTDYMYIHDGIHGSDIFEVVGDVSWTNIIPSGGFPTRWHKDIKTGDFNGDGKTDLFYWIGNQRYIAYSKGNSWEEVPVTTWWGFSGAEPNSTNITTNSTTYTLGDFNGDGRTDILERVCFEANNNPNEFNYARKVFYSIGIGFNAIHSPTIIDKYLDFNYHHSLTGDFNGDGRTDIFSREYYPINSLILRTSIEYYKDNGLELVKIEPNTNSSYEIQSKPLTQSTHFKRSYGRVFSNAFAIVPAFNIVEQIEYKVTNTPVHTIQKYYYQSLLMHRHGRGIMGFEKTSIAQAHLPVERRTFTETSFTPDPEFGYKLIPTTVSTYRTQSTFGFPSGLELLTERKMYYSIIPTLDDNTRNTLPKTRNIHFMYVNKEEQTDLLKKVKRFICYEYDNNGNATFTRTTHYRVNNFNVVEHVESNYSEYVLKGSWLPSVPSRTLKTMLRINGSTSLPLYRQQVDYTSNGRNKILSQEEFVNDPTLYSANHFHYDAYGNRLSTKIDYAGNNTGNPLTIEAIQYDPNGIYPVSKQNKQGHITRVLYEPVYGHIIYSRAPGGLQTWLTYDHWGRKQRDSNSLGAVERVQLIKNPQVLPSFVTSYSYSTATIRTNNLGQEVITYYNNANMQVAERVKKGPDRFVYSNIIYNEADLTVNAQSNIYDVASNRIYTTYDYDLYGRQIKIKYRNIDMKTIAYENNEVKETTKIEGVNVHKTTYFYATGNVEKITDEGGTVTYTLGSHNQPTQINANGSVTTIVYTPKLQKAQLTDPNAGITTYEYNGLGQLIKQTDARDKTYEMAYDIAGRLITKWGGDDEEYLYEYENDTSSLRLGALKTESLKIAGNETHLITYKYNTNGQLIETNEEAVTLFATKTTRYFYNAQQMVSQVEYPNIKLEYRYNTVGELERIMYTKQGRNTSHLLWQNLAETPDGKPLTNQLGNGHLLQYTYDDLQQLTRIRTATPQSTTTPQIVAMDMAYSFQLQSGNLKSKTDLTNSLGAEVFYYDKIDRLYRIDQTGKPRNTNINAPLITNTTSQYSYQINYAANGNITAKYDAGELTYGAKPNAVVSNKYKFIGLTPYVTPENERANHQITYNAFGKATHINQQYVSSVPVVLPYSINFTYGVHQQRISMEIIEDQSPVNTTYYINSANMEIVNGDEITYIYNGNTPVAMHRKNTDEILYLHTDYQLSLMAITNEAGQVVERRSYDAWGRPRRHNNWEYNLPSPFGGSNSAYTLRGYTFHEHLEMVGLINMNARLYDPILGRVLSPDNYVQDATSTQSFNRYSYCWNNPTKYTDPDGNIIFTAIALIAAPLTAGASLALLPYTIGADVGMWQGGTMANGTANPFKWDYSSGKTWAYMGVGAAVGAVSGAAGAGAGAGLKAMGLSANHVMYGALTGMVSGATGGFFTGGLSGVHKNGKWSWNDAWNGMGMGAAGGFLLGGLSTAVGNGIMGRNIWNGKVRVKPSSPTPYWESLSEAEIERLKEEGFIPRQLNRSNELGEVESSIDFLAKDLSTTKKSVPNYEVKGVSRDDVWQFLSKDNFVDHNGNRIILRDGSSYYKYNSNGFSNIDYKAPSGDIIRKYRWR
ncbi:MAG: FG-GAP-like repeat-containing protein [Bacteroidia bacterium]|jgi:RHS repeat-associated protein|nr:FG-GAP-like repeat-containing protein [Bacteroidia bacterium]